MPLILVRVDDRLIHGQVVEGWLRHISVDCIIVINDAVAKDEMQCALYGMSVPTGVEVHCLGVETAINGFREGLFNRKNVMVLLSNVQDTLKLAEAEIGINSINIGGLHWTSGKKQIFKALSVDAGDIAGLIKILRHGIELEIRILPMNDRIALDEKTLLSLWNS
ncbi:MAG: PTS sugar transporter subunit IIB [Elusimicrobia bacterium]|nr:PTS sugar transporter subunit IIB [Elusimicrobiota bacterium]